MFDFVGSLAHRSGSGDPGRAVCLLRRQRKASRLKAANNTRIPMMIQAMAPPERCVLGGVFPAASEDDFISVPVGEQLPEVLLPPDVVGLTVDYEVGRLDGGSKVELSPEEMYIPPMGKLMRRGFNRRDCSITNLRRS
jgi:hypothetical protein